MRPTVCSRPRVAVIVSCSKHMLFLWVVHLHFEVGDLPLVLSRHAKRRLKPAAVRRRWRCGILAPGSRWMGWASLGWAGHAPEKGEVAGLDVNETFFWG